MSVVLAILDQKKAIQLVSGNKQLADDLLAMFIKELPEYKTGIQEHMQQQNKEELQKTIHKMHGGLRYIGAPALLEIIAQTDSDLTALSETDLNNNISHIYQEIDRVLTEGKYNKS